MKRLLFTFSFALSLALPASSSAATLSLSADQDIVPVGDSFEVAVMLDTANEINAVGTAIFLPSGLEVVQTSSGNSIVSLWVEQPQYHKETGVLTFSGIIPSGFIGTGQLLKLTLSATEAGSFGLSFDRARTELYRNTPDALKEPTTLLPLTLRTGTGAVRPVSSVDTEPPEAFAVHLTHDPQLYEDAWVLVFATQDKGSGVAFYEVSESSVRVSDPSELAWTRVESPYRLVNQAVARYLYVRATDGEGNTRIELFTSPRSLLWWWVIGLGILMAVFVLFLLSRRSNKLSHVS